jgi:hypothetical protein
MVHVVSVVLTIAALLGCATASIFGLGPRNAFLPIGGTIFVVGVVEFWLAARVMLDAELFEAIAARTNDLAGFDRAMRDLGLVRADKTSRDLSQRILSTFRLLKLQVAALGIQIAVLVAGALSA